MKQFPELQPGGSVYSYVLATSVERDATVLDYLRAAVDFAAVIAIELRRSGANRDDAEALQLGVDLTSGSAATAATSRWMRSTTAAGVPVGATSPAHVEISPSSGKFAATDSGFKSSSDGSGRC